MIATTGIWRFICKPKMLLLTFCLWFVVEVAEVATTVFRVDESLCYCPSTKSLFVKLRKEQIASEGHLFLDSSKRSLKAVLLHIDSNNSSVAIARSVHLKKSYKSIEILLNAVLGMSCLSSSLEPNHKSLMSGLRSSQVESSHFVETNQV